MMKFLVLCLCLVALLSAFVEGSHNEIYTYAQTFGLYDMMSADFYGTSSRGGCLIDETYIYFNGGWFYGSGNCFGQWEADGVYLYVYNNGGPYYYFDPSQYDSFGTQTNGPGPIFTSTNPYGDDENNIYGVPAYSPLYFRSVSAHNRVFINEDGTGVAYLGLRNDGATTQNFLITSAPEQYDDIDPLGNGWGLSYDNYQVTYTSNGNLIVEDSDAWFTVDGEYGSMTTSTHGTVDFTFTTQAVYYDTTNAITGAAGSSGNLEGEVTHTMSIPPGETHAILTFFQICDDVLGGEQCDIKAQNLNDEVAIFNAGYVNWLDALRLSQVVNYDAVALSTGVLGGDPHLTPLTGVRRTEDVHGNHGDIINVISDEDLVLNMQLKVIDEFVELGSDATFIESFGLLFPSGNQLLVSVAADGIGWEATFDGEQLAFGDRVQRQGVSIAVDEAPTGKLFNGWFSKRYASHKLQAMVHIITPRYNIEIYPVYKDSFVNWHSADPGAHSLIEDYSFLDMDLGLIQHDTEPRGILGETAHPSKMRSDESLDERVQRYTVRSLFDTTFQ